MNFKFGIGCSHKSVLQKVENLKIYNAFVEACSKLRTELGVFFIVKPQKQSPRAAAKRSSVNSSMTEVLII